MENIHCYIQQHVTYIYQLGHLCGYSMPLVPHICTFVEIQLHLITMAYVAFIKL